MSIPVDIKQTHAARLEALAGRRDEDGISHLVERALDRFLVEEEGRCDALRDAFRALGASRIEEALTGSKP